MKIIGSDDAKHIPDEPIIKVSSQPVGERNVDEIELQLFQLMTGSPPSDNPEAKSTELSDRVAEVASMRNALEENVENTPLSNRLKLVITVADQWIKAKKVEAGIQQDHQG